MRLGSSPLARWVVVASETPEKHRRLHRVASPRLFAISVCVNMQHRFGDGRYSDRNSLEADAALRLSAISVTGERELRFGVRFVRTGVRYTGQTAPRMRRA